MRNQEIAKGLRLIAEGFTTLAVAFENVPVVTGVDMSSEEDKTVETVIDINSKKVVSQEVVEPIKEEVTEIKEAEQIEMPLVEKPQAPEVMTEEELNKLSYNDIKAMAKQLGVKAVGSKKSIIDNILSLNAPQEPTEDVIVPEEETTEAPIVVDVEEDRGDLIDIEEEDDLEGVEAEPEDEQSLYDQVVADLEGYSDEELADILSDIGISPKGRRQALLAKIVQAIEDGKLEWAEDEEDSVTEEQPPVDVEQVQEEKTGEDDFEGTEARKQACWQEYDSIEADYNKGNLSHKDIIKFLKDYYNGRYVSKGEEQDLDEYIAIQCELIDDEGIKHELADPYYIGDDICCCGQVLKELQDGLLCEICGSEYVNE